MSCGNAGSSSTQSCQTQSTTLAYKWFTPWGPATSWFATCGPVEEA